MPNSMLTEQFINKPALSQSTCRLVKSWTVKSGLGKLTVNQSLG